MRLSETSVAVPTYLFRYLRDDDRLLETLTTPYLWFSDPRSLNDPFDLTNVLEFAGSSDELCWYLRKYGRHLDAMSDTEIRALIESNDTLPKILSEITAAFHDVYLQRIGVCCCSFRNDSPLMWAHYSGGHSGVCVAINAPLLVLNYSLIEVQYRAELPKWNLLKNRHRYGESIHYNRNFDQIVLGTKYREWAYEEEYRLISPNRGQNTIDPECLAGIILGARMDQKRKDEIVATVRSCLPNVQLVDAELDQRSGLVFIPLFTNEKRLGTLSGWRLLTDREGEVRNLDWEDYLQTIVPALSGLPYPHDKFEVGFQPSVRIYRGGTLKNLGPKVTEVKGLITEKGLDLPNNTLLFTVNPATGNYLHTPHVHLYLVASDETEHYVFSFEIAPGPPNPLRQI